MPVFALLRVEGLLPSSRADETALMAPGALCGLDALDEERGWDGLGGVC